MKRTERRHLKDNELVVLATTARRTIEQHRRVLTAAAVLAVLVAGALVGYLAWSNRTEGRAGRLLADAMNVEEARVGPPPASGTPSPSGLSFATEREKRQAALTKFKIVADEYPATDAGIFARYREAATFMALGEPASAARSYQDVIDKGGDRLYAQMARLGLAEAQAQTGQYDQAISTFKSLAEQKDVDLPVDGILMRLGRAYLDAGKRSDAEQTFNQLVAQFPESSFSRDARRELDSLKKPS
jgi:TolA-binding protein